jgi:hypothetical protein
VGVGVAAGESDGHWSGREARGGARVISKE